LSYPVPPDLPVCEDPGGAGLPDYTCPNGYTMNELGLWPTGPDPGPFVSIDLHARGKN
jgi:hypothetical protein